MVDSHEPHWRHVRVPVLTHKGHKHDVLRRDEVPDLVLGHQYVLPIDPPVINQNPSRLTVSNSPFLPRPPVIVAWNVNARIQCDCWPLSCPRGNNYLNDKDSASDQAG